VETTDFFRASWIRSSWYSESRRFNDRIGGMVGGWYWWVVRNACKTRWPFHSVMDYVIVCMWFESEPLLLSIEIFFFQLQLFILHGLHFRPLGSAIENRRILMTSLEWRKKCGGRWRSRGLPQGGLPQAWRMQSNRNELASTVCSGYPFLKSPQWTNFKENRFNRGKMQ